MRCWHVRRARQLALSCRSSRRDRYNGRLSECVALDRAGPPCAACCAQRRPTHNAATPVASLGCDLEYVLVHDCHAVQPKRMYVGQHRPAQARTSPCPTSEPQLRPAVLLKPAQSCRARIGFDATIGGSYGLVSYDWVRMAALLGLFLGQRCHLGRPSDCLDPTRCYCAEQREATVGEHKAHGRREAYGHTSCGNKSGKSRCARVGL